MRSTDTSSRDEMGRRSLTVLVVDDESDMRTLVRLVLQASGYGIRVVAEAVDGLGALEEFDRLDPPVIPDVVILDNRMPGLSGLDVAERMLRRCPEQRIVLYSAHLTDEIRATAATLGIGRCVSKDLLEELPEIVAGLATSA